MKNLTYLLMFFSFAYSQCDNYNEPQCSIDQMCEWVEDIETVTCASLVWDEELCEAAPECTYSCWDAGGYFGWCEPECTGGMTYIDNGYCQEVEMPECSEMNQIQCNGNIDCNWVEDIESGSCSSLYSDECDSTPGCSWDYDCVQWGSWYTWICYEYGYECNGGTYYVDNGYCEETVEYLMGDINGDSTINILDVIETVNLILNGTYNYIVDMDNDSDVNVIDIIQMINIILNQIAQ